ncbi:ABC transporter substrate-binding protein [Clostridium sp. SHJSY1]|uniref:substrate-binding periplasmic protein n=1 Tax=Clostridium sp. SHJSY1 TaxID=2942483 RepID=UPI002875B179|nr:ABC transporter substrate-binding protein [Clostridium sp. SHJSY1]MDS0526989.1 ABC transporter substrate-binding protein [Clostridium sp. SHJSY1]
MKRFQICFLTLILFFIDCINSSYICNAKINISPTPNSTVAIDRLEKIKQKGVLTIVSSNNPPFSFLDSETGKLTGIDGDIITEVAKRLGVNKVEMKITTFDKLFTEILADDEIDMIVSGIYITEPRKEYVNFSTPWYKDYDIFVVPELSNIQFMSQLKDKVVGALAGAVDEPYVRKLKEEGIIKDFILFSNQPELLNAVNSGKVVIGISDAITFPYLLQKDKKLRLRSLNEIPIAPDIMGEVAAGIRHEDTTLLSAVNEKINEMKRDKTFSQIVKKYGVNENSIIPPPPYFHLN